MIASSTAFVVWTKAELKGFVNQFSRQALAKQSNIGAVADCVTIARTHCSSLSVIGLDLTFVLNSLMLKGMQDVLQYNKEQLIEASRHRNMVSSLACWVTQDGCLVWEGLEDSLMMP